TRPGCEQRSALAGSMVELSRCTTDELVLVAPRTAFHNDSMREPRRLRGRAGALPSQGQRCNTPWPDIAPPIEVPFFKSDSQCLHSADFDHNGKHFPLMVPHDAVRRGNSRSLGQ